MSKKREAVVGVKIGRDGRWRFSAVGANYEITGAGEGYASQSNAARGARRAGWILLNAPIRVVVS